MMQLQYFQADIIRAIEKEFMGNDKIKINLHEFLNETKQILNDATIKTPIADFNKIQGRLQYFCNQKNHTPSLELVTDCLRKNLVIACILSFDNETTAILFYKKEVEKNLPKLAQEALDFIIGVESYSFGLGKMLSDMYFRIHPKAAKYGGKNENE